MQGRAVADNNTKTTAFVAIEKGNRVHSNTVSYHITHGSTGIRNHLNHCCFIYNYQRSLSLFVPPVYLRDSGFGALEASVNPLAGVKDSETPLAMGWMFR